MPATDQQMTQDEAQQTSPNGAPLVSIGLPVYNGENYLSEAIESILNQTYTNFELIICDNASTDATERICREAKKHDPRIQYYRSPTNLGASANFNRTVELSEGKYFKWAAHDDRCAPEYLENCVALMEEKPEVVLCHSYVTVIDKDGRKIRDYEDGLDNLSSDDPVERFKDMTSLGHLCFDIFGLIRTSTLQETPMIASFVGSDRSLLAELSLRGKLYRVPGRFFYSRNHPKRSIKSIPRNERAKWFDTSASNGRVMPYCLYLNSFIRCLKRCPVSTSVRARCALHLCKWMVRYWRLLAHDVRQKYFIKLDRSATAS